jgi:predicted nuclease with TOPRIM domain
MLPMPNNYQKLDEIYARVQQLVDQHRTLEKEKDELEEENRTLRNKVEEEQKRVAELERQVKMLQLAKQVTNDEGSDDEQKRELKRSINEYIREIDSCIAMLKSE